MPASPPFPAWTMSEMVENALCEKFEANVFAKSRCQNCFRTIGAHQPGYQAPEKHALKTLDCGDGTIEPGPCKTRDPLCILVPQCEVYECVDSEERTEGEVPESWQESLEYTQLSSRVEEEEKGEEEAQESLEYTQLSSRVEEETEEGRVCHDTNSVVDFEADVSAALSRGWEMTRLLDSILGSDKDGMMYYAAQKRGAQPENPHSDRPRWAEMAPSRACGKTEPRSSLKAESKTVSQDHGDSRKKHPPENGYFSLERRKSEPSRASSPPQAGRGVLPSHGDAVRASGWPASSISSADSDLSWRTSGGSSEGQHGLVRQDYTVLADLPKPKRLNHRQAFEKERSSSRTRSPGRAEVERIFGHERRKSETLGAFQALEEGLLERLDSKTLKLAKEGRLVRRKSSPTLRKEVNKRLPWEPEQPSRSKGDSLRLGRPEQRPERASRSQGPSSCLGSPSQRPERESRSRGAPLHSAVSPPKQGERERRKQQDAVYHFRVEKERAPLQLGSHGKQVESSRKSQLEASSHHKSSGKTTDTKWRSCLDALPGAGPGKSLDKSRASHRRPLQEAGKPQERYKDSDRKARGKPLLPVDTREHPRKDPRDGGDAVRTLSPGRKMAADGKGGQALSPPRRTEDSWKPQGEARRSLSPGRPTGIGLPSRGEFESPFSPGRGMSGSQRESGRSLSPGRHVEIGVRSRGEVGAVLSLGYQRESRRSPSPGRCRESSPRAARRSPSPGRPMASSCSCPKQERSCALPEQHPGSSWNRPWEAPARTQRAGMGSDWPSREEQPNPFAPRSDWQGCDKSLHPASPPGEPSCPTNPFWRPEMRQQSREEPLCQVHPMPPLEKEWVSPGEVRHSAKPGQLPSEGTWRDRGSSAGWIEEEWKTQGKCPDPGRGEKQMENDLSHDEKLLHQHQPDGGPHLTSACSSSSQNAYLSTSKKHQPDLLNFKKGWMSILHEPGEWTKHWFVLTDSSLKYYRDSNAEEADDLDGEVDLRSCTDVTEYSVQRNYGFQIHTKDGIFTLSAMTSGIRRNWIEALRKSVRPASVPDVTKLSDCNKENSFRSYGSQKGSSRSEEQRPGTGSEVISRSSSRKADGQRHAFDYVELSPLQPGPLNQGSPQRTRGSARAADGAGKREELERDLASRSEERRKWFESPASAGALQPDGVLGSLGHRTGGQEPRGAPLSEAQRSRLSEEIEKKWQELERLPLKDSKRVPLTALLSHGKGNQEETSEALEKEIQVLRSQLESLRAQSDAKSHRDGHVPQGYISQEACERSLAEMETSHQRVMAELQRHHQRETERLQKEKERLLMEEAAATAAAIEALKKAHREELSKELGRTRSFQKAGVDPDTLRRQHQSDVESLKRELQVLSEQYSQKCLEIGDLVQKAEEQEHTLQHCQQEGKELLRQNQELQRRLSEEIGQLRAFIAAQGTRDGVSHERNSCELEVLLRVKENELQYLKQEVQCLRQELQMMQKDKRFASGKYQDVYAELNQIKRRSEREIEQLKEHLRLAVAALQEKETLCNSIG